MLIKGRYQVREARTPEDLGRAQALRALCFGQGRDDDPLDARCIHMLVEENDNGALVCCFRLLPLRAGALDQSYAAQFYDLSALAAYSGLMMEMGRFCVVPGRRDPDILRLAWAAMTQRVDDLGVEMLFGCSSFEGVDPVAYQEAFALLARAHLAPQAWQPARKAPEVFQLSDAQNASTDPKAALRCMPSLLRTYLLMGGWVSDHAVIDRELNTLHVFTGVEIGAIPLARKRLLRALI